MAAAMAYSRCVSASAWRPPRLSRWLTKLLEHEFHRPLHDARRDAASAGGIEGRAQLPEGSGVRRIVRGRGALRQSEVRIVEDVECFQSDPEMQPLEQHGVLGHRQILIEETRTSES